MTEDERREKEERLIEAGDKLLSAGERLGEATVWTAKVMLGIAGWIMVIIMGLCVWIGVEAASTPDDAERTHSSP